MIECDWIEVFVHNKKSLRHFYRLPNSTQEVLLSTEGQKIIIKIRKPGPVWLTTDIKRLTRVANDYMTNIKD